MEEIKIMTNISIDDYIRYNFYTMNKYNKLNLQYNFLVLFGIANIIYSFFSSLMLWYLFLIIGLMSIAIRYRYPVSIAKRLKKLVKDSPNILGNGEITINKDEIVEVTNISTTHIKWYDIYSIDEDGDKLYIFFSRIQAFIIDQSLLSDTEVNQLKAWFPEIKQK